MQHGFNHEDNIFQEKTGLWVAEVYPDGKKRRTRSKIHKMIRDWLLVQREAIQKSLWVEDHRFPTQYLNIALEEVNLS